MKIAKKLTPFSVCIGCAGVARRPRQSLAQEAPAPGAAEPAKVEAPAARLAAAARRRRRIRARRRRSLPRGFWSRLAGPRWQRIRCGR